MNYTPDLKPCPFCGGDARVVNTCSQGCCYDVECRVAGCHASKGPYLSRGRAVKEWNRRINDKEGK